MLDSTLIGHEPINTLNAFVKLIHFHLLNCSNSLSISLPVSLFPLLYILTSVIVLLLHVHFHPIDFSLSPLPLFLCSIVLLINANSFPLSSFLLKNTYPFFPFLIISSIIFDFLNWLPPILIFISFLSSHSLLLFPNIDSIFVFIPIEFHDIVVVIAIANILISFLNLVYSFHLVFFPIKDLEFVIAFVLFCLHYSLFLSSSFHYCTPIHHWLLLINWFDYCFIIIYSPFFNVLIIINCIAILN